MFTSQRSNKTSSSATVIAAVMAGAGVVTAAWILSSRKQREALESDFNSIVDSCQKAAQTLENRLSAVA